MNYKLEKFWNSSINFSTSAITIWTINLKSFEIKVTRLKAEKSFEMNYKLEKFWNTVH